MEEKKYKYTVIMCSKSSRSMNKTKELYDNLLNTVDSIEESYIEYTDAENKNVDISAAR